MTVRDLQLETKGWVEEERRLQERRTNNKVHNKWFRALLMIPCTNDNAGSPVTHWYIEQRKTVR